MNYALPRLLALHMRVPRDLPCPVLLHEPPFPSIDGLTADSAYDRRTLLEPHRFLLSATLHHSPLIEDTRDIQDSLPD